MRICSTTTRKRSWPKRSKTSSRSSQEHSTSSKHQDRIGRGRQSQQQPTKANRFPPACCACPLRDQADEAAARMLAQLLTAEGLHVETGGADSLTGEVVDRVASDDIDVVVISILPPITPRDSRLLWNASAVATPTCRSSSASGTAPCRTNTSRRRKTTRRARSSRRWPTPLAQVRAIAAQKQLVAKTG